MRGIATASGHTASGRGPPLPRPIASWLGHKPCAPVVTPLRRRADNRGRQPPKWFPEPAGSPAGSGDPQRTGQRQPLRLRRAASTAGEHSAAPPATKPGEAARGAPLTVRRRADWVLTVPPAVTLAVMLWGIAAPSYWRDEAATLSAVSRTLPQLFRMLGTVDAVHGLYYLLLWPVTRLAGTGEFATRLPSALAMAAADLGVTAIARDLCSRRAAWCAGLMFALLPEVSVQGHNARPYAMVTAAAVLASYLLLRALADPRPRRFAAYGLAMVLTGSLHLFALLLVPAHTITLMRLDRPSRSGHSWWRNGHGRRSGQGQRCGQDQRRSQQQQRSQRQPCGQPGSIGQILVVRRWLATIAAVGIAIVPVGILGWLQRGQIGWLTESGWPALRTLVTSLALGSGASAALIGALAVLGGCHGLRPREGRPGPGLTWLAVPWLALPPAMLLAVSQINPVYDLQYVAFCLPAVALLTGAGLAVLDGLQRAAALTLIAALALPAQLAIRGPGSGGSLRAAAQVLAAHERPGDAVIYPAPAAYPGPTIPADNLVYPSGFGSLRNIGLARTPAAAGRLNGISVPVAVLKRRECGTRRIWAIEMGPHWQDPG